MALTGCCCVDARELSLSELIEDLIEMARAIQHPLKSIVLRHYMLMQMRDRLPARGRPVPAELTDSCTSFLLRNLGDSTRLWVRMQRMQTAKREDPDQEKPRDELIPTITDNLTRLSTLSGLELEMYTKSVLPRLMGQINSCKDRSAQQFLLDGIIQTFPDRFHLHTLPELLGICVMLGKNENVAGIRGSVALIMEKVSNYASSAEHKAEVEAIDQSSPGILMQIKKCIDRVLEEQAPAAQKGSEIKRVLELPLSFISAALKNFSGRVPAIDAMLDSCILYVVQPRGEGPTLPHESQRNFEKTMTGVIDAITVEIFQMDSFPRLLTYIPSYMRRSLSKQIVKVFSPVISSRS